MISEVSRDTEDWSNDAENSALHHRVYNCFLFWYILKCNLCKKTIILNCNIISQILLFILHFFFLNQINAALIIF